MNFWVFFWLAVSIGFEVAGDYFIKVASNTLGANSKWLWVITLFFYNLMLIAWMVAIHNCKQITIPGTIWLICGQLALVILGTCVFGEHVSLPQKVGIGLSLVAVVCLSI